MIEINNLTVTFTHRVLDSFTLKITDNGVYCIYGESGRGKTTLFNAISKLVTYEGSIRYDGKLSYLFQDDRLLPWLNAWENITVAAGDLNKAEYYAEIFEINGFREKMPKELSGGMRRRVAIARCFSYGGDVFLLDEPFTGLDSANILVAAKEITALAEKSIVLVVTHNDDDTKLLNAKRIDL